MSDTRVRQEAPLVAQLRELDAGLREAGVRYMVIGGVAVSMHGYVRATSDLDIMVAVGDTDAVHEWLLASGYRSLDRRKDLASYLRGALRLDILYAGRSTSLALLDRREEAGYESLRIPVISLEGLLGLKLQAFHDDPRRLRDLQDMLELFKTNRKHIDIDEVRGYFRLFDRESLLDDILRTID